MYVIQQKRKEKKSNQCTLFSVNYVSYIPLTNHEVSEFWRMDYVSLEKKAKQGMHIIGGLGSMQYPR